MERYRDFPFSIRVGKVVMRTLHAVQPPAVLLDQLDYVFGCQRFTPSTITLYARIIRIATACMNGMDGKAAHGGGERIKSANILPVEMVGMFHHGFESIGLLGSKPEGFYAFMFWFLVIDTGVANHFSGILIPPIGLWQSLQQLTDLDLGAK